VKRKNQSAAARETVLNFYLSKLERESNTQRIKKMLGEEFHSLVNRGKRGSRKEEIKG